MKKKKPLHRARSHNENDELPSELLPHKSYSPGVGLSDDYLLKNFKRMLTAKIFSSNKEVGNETDAKSRLMKTRITY